MEDTQTLVEEYIASAQPAPEPGDIKKNEVIHKGDDDTETPILVESIESAGYVYVYDTVTADRSKINRNMLAMQLKKKRPNGKPYFTTIKPNFEPKRGTHKCLLHRDDSNRNHYDELGFAVCPKDNLINAYQVRRHMQKRHPAEWATIEEERKEKERQEDRAIQQAILNNMKPVSKPVATEENEEKEYKCDVCGKLFKNQLGLTGHMRSHK